MKPNNHTAPSDADMLHEVDQLVNQGRASGDPILDSLRTHIPRAEAAQAQALEDELLALWEGNEQVKENVGQYPATPFTERSRLAQPSRAGRLPYVATLAAMIAVVMAVVLLNRPPSSAPTGSQVVVTSTPGMTVNWVNTIIPNSIMSNPVIVVTATPSNGLVDVITATPSVPPAEATAIQAELNAVTATYAANPANADAQPIDPVYATATYIVAQATAIQAENLAATQASQPTQVSQPTLVPIQSTNAGNCYLIQEGDTITVIAEEVGLSPQQLFQYNGDLITEIEGENGVVYTLELWPSTCLRLYPSGDAAPNRMVPIIAPISLLVPRDIGQPRPLEVGDRISLYLSVPVGTVEYSTEGDGRPFAPMELKLLASGIEVVQLLDYASEYVISVPANVQTILAWLWSVDDAIPIIYVVE